MRFPIVLFDLDGTLIDSGPMILASFRYATSTVLGRDLPEDELSRGIGGASTLLGQMRVLDPARADELVDVYRSHNKGLHAHLQACAGIVDALDELRGQGRRLGIVTAKRRATVELAFAVLPLAPLFDVIVGQDDVEHGKPHPDGLLLALDRLGAAPADAAYVGDSPHDVGAAKAAGVHSVAVTWGGLYSRAALDAAEPDAIAEAAGELLALL